MWWLLYRNEWSLNAIATSNQGLRFLNKWIQKSCFIWWFDVLICLHWSGKCTCGVCLWYEMGDWDNNKIPNSKVHSHTVPALCPCTYMTVPRVMCGLHLSTAIPWSLLRLNKHDKWTQGNGLLHKGQARVYVYNSLLFIVYRSTADCLFIFLSKNCMVGWGRSVLRVNILCK